MERRRYASSRSSRSSAIRPSDEIASCRVSAKLSPIQSRLEVLETLKNGKTRYVSAAAAPEKTQRHRATAKNCRTQPFYRAAQENPRQHECCNAAALVSALGMIGTEKERRIGGL